MLGGLVVLQNWTLLCRISVLALVFYHCVVTTEEFTAWIQE